MKVKELKKILDKFDPNLNIFCYTEDDIENKNGNISIIFDIDSADETEAEITRTSDRKPNFKFTRSDTSTKFVILNVTTTF